MTKPTDQPPAPVPATATQAGTVRDRWSWAEPTVWTERMLTALETGVKGGVWFSLMDKVCALRNLTAGLARVQANGGAAGVDHVTVERFAEHQASHLEKLAAMLRLGTYEPQAVRRVYIPKPDGTQRPRAAASPGRRRAPRARPSRPRSP